MTRRWVALLLWCAALLSGCATINAQSAVRLSGDAQLTARAMIDSLEGTRRSLSSYVEGQALAAKLSGREGMAPQALCSVRSVQHSLRLRIIILRKLIMLYDRFTELSQFDLGEDTPPLFDELMLDVDRYEHLPDALAAGTTAAANCPETEPEPWLAHKEVVASPPLPALTRISHDRSMRLASSQIRTILDKVRTLWDRERGVYLSVQKAAVLSQKTLTRLLLTRFGSLSPSLLFAPHLTGLGLDWDAHAYVLQRDKLPADQQAALQDALLAAIELRSQRLIAEEDARATQHSELLQVLVRQHAILEEGHPIDLRHLAWYLVPLLKSVNISTCSSHTLNGSSPYVP